MKTHSKQFYSKSIGHFLLKFLTAGIALLLSLFAQVRPVVAQDLRPLKLIKYFKAQNSPLTPYAFSYVSEADKAGLDYRLLPAISGVESTFGQQFMPGTFNVYGWGGGLLYFKSWEDGITQVSQGLKNNYVARGAKEVEQIGYIYCPPNPIGWAAKVRHFMALIDQMDVSFASNSKDLAVQLPLTL